MNREILFKAKRVGDGRWVEGYYIYHIKRTPCVFNDSVKPEDEMHVIMHDGFSDWNMPRDTVTHMIDPDTLCQFTGLYDKNGNRIWEGDILKGFEYPFLSEGNHNYYAEVIWFDNVPAFGLYTRKNPRASVAGISAGNTDFIEGFNSDSWIVIGNIYDNPEFLEGGVANE